MMIETEDQLRPGWAEIAVAFVGLGVGGFLPAALLLRSGLDPIALGLILTAVTGVGGLLGFLAAFLLRIRTWKAFGIRRTSLRWIGIGAGLGVVAFLAKGFAVIAYMALTGDEQNPQNAFAPVINGGIWAIIAATLFIGIVVPIAEEFLFRGVVTTALLRYGAFPGVGGGALIFALFHGINVVFPAALVGGLVAGEVFRRSGSIWPAVMVHVMFNLPTIPLMVLTSTAASA